MYNFATPKLYSNLRGRDVGVLENDSKIKSRTDYSRKNIQEGVNSTLCFVLYMIK